MGVVRPGRASHWSLTEAQVVWWHKICRINVCLRRRWHINNCKTHFLWQCCSKHATFLEPTSDAEVSCSNQGTKALYIACFKFSSYPWIAVRQSEFFGLGSSWVRTPRTTGFKFSCYSRCWQSRGNSIPPNWFFDSVGIAGARQKREPDSGSDFG